VVGAGRRRGRERRKLMQCRCGRWVMEKGRGGRGELGEDGRSWCGGERRGDDARVLWGLTVSKWLGGVNEIKRVLVFW